MGKVQSLKNRIVASAVKYNSIVFTGVRHCEIFADIRNLGFSGPYTLGKGFIQGFIDLEGNFLSREDALKVVITSGQPYKKICSTLTSEDLW